MGRKRSTSPKNAQDRPKTPKNPHWQFWSIQAVDCGACLYKPVKIDAHLSQVKSVLIEIIFYLYLKKNKNFENFKILKQMFSNQFLLYGHKKWCQFSMAWPTDPGESNVFISSSELQFHDLEVCTKLHPRNN